MNKARGAGGAPPALIFWRSNMKKIITVLALAAVLLSLALSLTSCGATAEDIKGIKVTKATLEFNFYEVKTYEKEQELAEVGATEHLKGIIVAKGESDDVVVLYCVNSAAVSDARDYLSALAEEYGEGYSVYENGTTLILATETGLKYSTKMPWKHRLYHTFIEDNRYMYIVEGFGVTILITLGALLIGVILGVLVAVLKYYAEDNPKLRVINAICDIYTTVIRGIPIVVLLMIFSFVVLVSADGILVAIIAFGINSGAYMAELVRSGINAVDKGQMEAARSLGMSKWQAMRTIIFPQAVKNILPAIGNECIALLKETSVAGYVAVVDLTRGADLLRNLSFDAFNPLILSALIYLILVIGMTKLLSVFERRLKKSER